MWMEMDCQIWGNLPPNALLRVLALLPLQDFARFRCVCKEWRNMALCRPAAEVPWIVTNQAGCVWRLSIESNEWRVFPVTNFMESVEWRKLYFPALINLGVTATAGSLLLLLLARRNFSTVDVVNRMELLNRGLAIMIVCNPLQAHSWTLLPRRPGVGKFTVCFVGLIAYKEKVGFKVVVVGEALATEIYDSITDAWKLIPAEDCFSLPLNIMLTHPLQNSPSDNGKLVILAHAGLYVFDGEKETWTSSPGPEVRKGWDPKVSYCGGRLLFVCRVSEENMSQKSDGVLQELSPKDDVHELGTLLIWEHVDGLDGVCDWRVVRSLLIDPNPRYNEAQGVAQFVSNIGSRDLVYYRYYKSPLLAISPSKGLLNWIPVKDELNCNGSHFKLEPRLDA